ncbi:MAG: alpha/beta hydrolase [Niabella sp.]
MKYVFPFLSLFVFSMIYAQTEIPLYDVVPNNKKTDLVEKHDTLENGSVLISNVVSPTITMYQPSHPNGTAVIICPGGGYAYLASVHEGHDVAKKLNEWGITAFVLKYRLPNTKINMDKSIAPLQDAERAIQLVRQNAKKWKLNPKKVGIMGFSAGGHLAASLSTRYDEVLLTPVKKAPLRPDFSVLIYPVISFEDSLTHKGSRNNLIGAKPSEYKIRQYSNELRVNKKTPPAFLVHAKDDGAVPYQNSIRYYEALLHNGITASRLKLFEKGGHGFGMNNPTTSEKWMDDLQDWLKEQKLL